MNARDVLAGSLAVLVLCVAARAGEPSAASKPAGTSKKKLTPEQVQQFVADYVRYIRLATTVDSAVETYAKACTVAGDSLELHNAYMRKALELERPEAATNAASLLMVLDPENATALGLVGYVHARKNQMSKAAKELFQAWKLRPDDPAARHNAAQLAAWYKYSGQRAAVPPDVKAAIQALAEKLEKQSGKKDPIARAYRKAKSLYEDRGRRVKEINDKIAKEQEKYDAIYKQAEGVNQEIRKVNQDIKRTESEARRTSRELSKVESRMRRRNRGSSERERYRRDRDRLLKRYEEQKRNLRPLRSKRKALMSKGRPFLQKMSTHKTAMAKLRGQATIETARPVKLTWRPPAVPKPATAPAGPPAKGPRTPKTGKTEGSKK